MDEDNEILIELLKKEGVLRDTRIAEALRAVPRGNFIPPELQSSAYENIPVPIGFGQTTSQPLTIVFMLELLHVEQGNKVFEIGTGLGWQTALLANLVGPKGKVLSFELISELAEFARGNLKKFPELNKRIEVKVGDATRIEPDLYFDRIIAGAAAKEITEVWKKALKIGGRLVAPVGRSVVVFHKLGEDEFKTEEYPGFVFVPLIVD